MENRPAPATWGLENRHEWRIYDKAAVPVNEVRAAVVWEFAREDKRFRMLAQVAKAYGPQPGRWPDEILDDRSIPHALLGKSWRLVWAVPEFPETPWVRLRQDQREKLSAEFPLLKSTPAGAALQIATVQEIDECGFLAWLNKEAEGGHSQQHGKRSEGQRMKARSALFHLSSANYPEDALFSYVTLRISRVGVSMDQINRESKRVMMSIVGKPKAARSSPHARIEKQLRSYLKGLALSRFRRHSKGTWKEVHDTIRSVTHTPIYNVRRRAGDESYENHQASKESAERFLSDEFLGWLVND